MWKAINNGKEHCTNGCWIEYQCSICGHLVLWSNKYEYYGIDAAAEMRDHLCSPSVCHMVWKFFSTSYPTSLDYISLLDEQIITTDGPFTIYCKDTGQIWSAPDHTIWEKLN